MKLHRTLPLAALIVGCACVSLKADFVVYRLGKSRSKIYLPGKVTRSGDLVTYKHPTIEGLMYFPRDDVEIKRFPTPQEEFENNAPLPAKTPTC